MCLEYAVPPSGSGAPYALGAREVAAWGQTHLPEEAMAIFPPDKVMGWPAKEYKRESVYYIDGKDHQVNTATPTGGISTSEYNSYNEVVRSLSPGNRATALKETCESSEHCKSAELSKLLDTEGTWRDPCVVVWTSKRGPVNGYRRPGVCGDPQGLRDMSASCPLHAWPGVTAASGLITRLRRSAVYRRSRTHSASRRRGCAHRRRTRAERAAAWDARRGA
jgi:hypothetical protein